MVEILTENETMNAGVLTNEEMGVLLAGVGKRTPKEKKSTSNPFNEIVKLDDRAIQKVMRKINSQEIAKALKLTGFKVKNKIFKNMTKRASTILKKDMEYMGPVRLQDIEEAQIFFF
jgi:flagellar motor switch protein FliG